MKVVVYANDLKSLHEKFKKIKSEQNEDYLDFKKSKKNQLEMKILINKDSGTTLSGFNHIIGNQFATAFEDVRRVRILKFLDIMNRWGGIKTNGICILRKKLIWNSCCRKTS